MSATTNLVITRKKGESIVIDGPAEITVSRLRTSDVRILINSRPTTSSVRRELIPNVDLEKLEPYGLC